MFKKISIYFIGIFLIFGGINHIVSPESYAPMIPDFIPSFLANYASAILEIGIGVGLFIPKYRSWSGLGLTLLMFLFLPIHALDLFKEESALIAVIQMSNPDFQPENPIVMFMLSIRLAMQFLLIYLGWWIWKMES